MNAKLLRWIGAILTAMMTVLFSSFLAPAQASAKAGCLPDTGKRLPVILVHGFGDRAAVWGSADNPNSTLHAIDSLFNVYAETFDYETTNKSWVDNLNNGPRLAERIACIAASSRQNGGPGKVALVGHSMGGLLIRYAAQPVDGRKMTDDIGLVATIGTPNTGSGWANAVESVLQKTCPTDKTEDNSVCERDALNGLRIHSPQIDELPQLPSTIPVMAIAGDVTVTYSVFRVPLRDTDSDLVVTKPSALKGATSTQSGGGEEVVACETNIESIDPVAIGTGIGQTAGKLAFKQPILPSCWHNGLPSNQEVKLAVTSTIEKYQRALAANQAFERYVGTWTVHGSKLIIKADRTGTQTSNLGRCFPHPDADSKEMCNQVARLKFAATPTALTVTVTSVTYEQWGGGAPPEGYKPDNNSGLRAGDAFKLAFQGEHVLRTTWLGRNSHLNEASTNLFWCNAYGIEHSGSIRECA